MKSDMTKKRLAETMKQLITVTPFVSISVADICDACGIHRKTFYYHFKDKYDLIAWIYDTELARYMAANLDSRFDGNRLLATLEYLHENKAFYSKRMEITGQNSFMEHFKKDLFLYTEKEIRSLLPEENVKPYQIGFISDGIAAAAAHWVQDRTDHPTEYFIKELHNSYRLIHKFYSRFD